MQRLVSRSNRGELEVRVPDVAQGARLVYAAAHQIIYSMLAVSAGIIAYLAHERREGTIQFWAAAASVVFLLAMAGSIMGVRRSQ